MLPVAILKGAAQEDSEATQAFPGHFHRLSMHSCMLSISPQIWNKDC